MNYETTHSQSNINRDVFSNFVDDLLQGNKLAGVSQSDLALIREIKDKVMEICKHRDYLKGLNMVFSVYHDDPAAGPYYFLELFRPTLKGTVGTVRDSLDNKVFVLMVSEKPFKSVFPALDNVGLDTFEADLDLLGDYDLTERQLEHLLHGNRLSNAIPSLLSLRHTFNDQSGRVAIMAYRRVLEDNQYFTRGGYTYEAIEAEYFRKKVGDVYDWRKYKFLDGRRCVGLTGFSDSLMTMMLFSRSC